MNTATIHLSESRVGPPVPMHPAELLPAAILARLAAGPDESAWDALVAQLSDDIRRVAQRLTGDAALADDAHQECLVTVLHNAARFEPPAVGADFAARAWILRIAAHIAMRLARSRSRLRQREHRAAEVTTTGGPDPDERLQREETAAQVRAGLAEIPEHQRAVIILHHMEGLEFASIAQAIGCPTATARVRAHRGLEQLRQILGRRGLALSLPLIICALRELPATTGTSTAAALTLQAASASAPDAGRYPPPSPRWEMSSVRRIAAVILLGAMLVLAAMWYADDGGQMTERQAVPVVSAAEVTKSAGASVNWEEHAEVMKSADAAVNWDAHVDSDDPMMFHQYSLSGSREALLKAGIDPDQGQQIVPAHGIRQIYGAGVEGLGTPCGGSGWITDDSSRCQLQFLSNDELLAKIQARADIRAKSQPAEGKCELVIVRRRSQDRYAVQHFIASTTEGPARNIHGVPTSRWFNCTVADLIVFGDVDMSRLPELKNVIKLDLNQALIVKAADTPPGENNTQDMWVFYFPEEPTKSPPMSRPQFEPSAPAAPTNKS